MSQKFCKGCSQLKNLIDYSFKNRRSNRRHYKCKSCVNIANKKYYSINPNRYKQRTRKRNIKQRTENRKSLIKFLEMHPCIDCGESNLYCLDFDHINKNKIANISEMIAGYSWQTIEKEILKCVVRCANCHRKKTAKQFNWYSNLQQGGQEA